MALNANEKASPRWKDYVQVKDIMPTQRPLADMIPTVIDHFERYKDYLESNRRIYQILEGQLRQEIEQSLAKEMVSRSAYKRIIERIPPINILKKVTDKLSKVYIEPPIRRADNATDNDIIENIVRNSHFDRTMLMANVYYNAQRMFAIEPYLKEGKHKFRVLGGHQFLPFSDDPIDPSNMTVFIKLMGNELKQVAPKFLEDGTRLDNADEVEQVTILGLYSDDEFLIVDTSGAIRYDKMQAMGLSIQMPQRTFQNRFGRIPFFYGSKSRTELVPYPNKEGLDASILIPKLFADLNYAAQFMSHSIIWFKNAKLDGQEINPDALVDLGERTEENGDPEMGVITPTVDIPNVISMIKTELSMYLSSIGIKANEQAVGREASGVAKAIEEGDTTAERKMQVEYFRGIEMEVWKLISDMQRVWAQRNGLGRDAERRTFSNNFAETFTIMFAEMKPLKTTRQKIEEIQLLRDQKLITKKQSIRMLYPEMTDNQIEEWLSELEDEREQEMDSMLSAGGTMMASRQANGTFSEGNQEAAEGSQDPFESEPEEDN